MYFVADLTFVPSISTDVAVHNFILSVDGEEKELFTLDAVPVDGNGVAGPYRFDSQLLPGQTVAVLGVAVDTAGNQSAQAHVITTVPNFPDREAPQAPTNLNLVLTFVEGV